MATTDTTARTKAQGDARPAITEFSGLNNVLDPLTMGMGAFVQADNIDINNSGRFQRAKGYSRASTLTSVTGAYATADLQRCYVVDNGTLYRVYPDMSKVSLKSLSSTDDVYFAEVNGVVFYSNGTDFGMLDGDGWKPWGIPNPGAPTLTVESSGSLRPAVYMVVCTYVDSRGMESGNSDVSVAQINAAGSCIYIDNIPSLAGYTTNVYVTGPDGNVFYLMLEGATAPTLYDLPMPLGRELPFWNVNLPRGSMPAYFAGRMYTFEYYPHADTTAVWRSLPLHYHHFDPGAEGVSIPGNVLQARSSRQTHFSGNERLTQRGVADAMIIGTDREIYSWDEDQLVLLADYGVVPGHHAVEYKGKVYLWTLRGVVRALPFENMTESTVSVPPGLSAAAAVIEHAGTRRYVVAMNKGGAAYNPH